MGTLPPLATPSGRHQAFPPERFLDRTGTAFFLPAAALVAALGLALLTGCAAHTRTRTVDVGGYALRIRCGGQGSPTVVMDAGLGDSLDQWGDVMPQAAKLTRVCAYDRAGLGRSGAGPEPRTSLQIARELRMLLANAGIEGPFVLVGHSFGGLNMRLFAAQYPEEAAGLVLVEATHEDYPERERSVMSSQDTTRMESAFGMASTAALSEYHGLGQSASQVRAAGSLPDIPVVVVTAGKHEGTPALKRLWSELQADLARRSPRARHVVAPESGHYVQFDQPEVVVGAIRSVIESVRERKNVARSVE